MKNIPHLLHDWILNYKTEGQLVLYSSWQATTFDFHFFIYYITPTSLPHALTATFKVLSYHGSTFVHMF